MAQVKATIATRVGPAVATAAVMLTGCSPVDGDVSVAGRAIGETVAGSPVAPATVREYTRDTRRIVHVSNGLVEFEIVPALGARIVGMKAVNADWAYFRDTGNLATPNPGSYAVEYGGYEEMVGPQDRYGFGHLWGREYRIQIEKNGPDEVVVVATGEQQPLRITRRMTLRAGDTAVRLNLTLRNIAEEPTPMAVWLHNACSTGPTAGPEDVFALEQKGKYRKWNYYLGTNEDFYHPTAPYWANVDSQLGEGLVWTFPHNRLTWLKWWHGGGGGGLHYGAELTTETVVFQPGEERSYDLAYWFFSGLHDLDYVTDGNIFALDLEPNIDDPDTVNLVLSRCAWQTGTARQARIALLADGVKRGEGAVDLHTRTTHRAASYRVPVELGKPAEGKFVLMCALLDANSAEIATFNKEVTVSFSADIAVRELYADVEANMVKIRRALKEPAGARALEGSAAIRMQNKVVTILWGNARNDRGSLASQTTALRDVLKRQRKLLAMLAAAN